MRLDRRKNRGPGKGQHSQVSISKREDDMYIVSDVALAASATPDSSQAVGSAYSISNMQGT